MKNRFYLYPLSLLISFLLYNYLYSYQAVLGLITAQVEIWKLRRNALITTQSIPPGASDGEVNVANHRR